MTEARLVLLLWCMLALLAGYQVLYRTTVSADLSVFLPGAQSNQTDILLALHTAGPAARIWLLALTGDTPENLATLSKRLTETLRQSNRFVTVANGPARLEEMERSLWFRYRYLLDPRVDKEYFSTPSLRAALQARLRELASPLSFLTRRLLPADPTGALSEVAGNLGGVSGGPASFHGVWFSPDRKQALLLAETRASGLDLAAQQIVLERIRSDVDALAPGSAIRLQLAGAPFIALQTQERIRKESLRLSVLAGGFMLVFILWVYRSPRRLVLTSLPLLGGLLFAVASVSVLFGNIHGIALAFGATLLGVAVDYPVHVLSHQHKGEAMATTLARIWPTLRLGALTTLLGYGAMIFSGFDGLAQLGMFSFVGLASAALLTRSLLPVLPAGPVDTLPRFLAPARVLTRRGPRWLPALMVIGVLVAVIPSFGDRQAIWSDDIADLSPVPAPLRQQDRMLRAWMGVPETGLFLAVEADRLETLLQRQEILWPRLQAAVEDQSLDGFMMAARWLPSARRQRARQALLPDAETLQRRLNEALVDLPFQPGLFAPFIQDVADSRTLPLLEAPALHAASLGGQLDNLLIRHGDRLIGLVQLIGVHDAAALRDRIGSDLAGVHFIDVRRTTGSLVDRFRRETLQRLGIAALVILLVLGAGLRNWNRLRRVLLPVGLAVGVAAAVPLGLGEQLNLFHLVSLLLVAGIGLDYSLFYSRRTDPDEDWRTTHALLICSFSTATVFAMLATSTIPVLHFIGITVASGVLAAFVLAWSLARPRTDV